MGVKRSVTFRRQIVGRVDPALLPFFISAVCASVQVQGDDSISGPVSVNTGITVLAQSTSPDVLGREPRHLPEQKPERKAPPPEFTLPPIDKIPGAPSDLSKPLNVFVKKIVVSGVTVFSQKEISEILQPYEGQEITSDKLSEVRIKLTQLYIKNGYKTSGAVIPDQKLENGVVRLHVFEGRLRKTKIRGHEWLRKSYIADRIALDTDPPINLDQLRDRLELLQQDPRVERVTADLKPAPKLGESDLNVTVQEASPFRMGLRVANDRSPTIGGIQGNIWLRHLNITGFGDTFNFGYSKTDGFDNYSADYSVPLSAYDTRLAIRYANSDANVIEDPFRQFNIRSRAETFGISMSHPFLQTLHQRFSLALAFEHRRSKTFQDGFPFSTTSGVPDSGKNKGESTISVVRLSQDWLDRRLDRVIAARSIFNVGIDAFDATLNPDGKPDGRFFSWLGQFQWLQRLPWLESQLLFRTDLHLASEALLPLEKFSVGGMYSVRGYRENLLVHDNGLAVSLEWRVPVFRLPIPGLSISMDDGIVQLAAFTDFGWSEDIDQATPQPSTIGSAGLGIRWDPSPKIHAEFYWGIPFRDVDNGNHNIQDSGIHFQVVTQLF